MRTVEAYESKVHVDFRTEGASNLRTPDELMTALAHKHEAVTRSIDKDANKAQLDEWTRGTLKMMVQNLAAAERVIADLGAENVLLIGAWAGAHTRCAHRR